MTASSAKTELKVFVSVGTHEQGFPRLLLAVREIIATEPGDIARWRVQTGPTSVDFPPTVERQVACSHEEMLSNLRWADAMISQASPGNVFAALAELTQPVVVARRRELSEHVDNHQTVFAAHLSASGLAMVAQDASSLGAHLGVLGAEHPNSRRERLAQLYDASRKRTESWVTRFDYAIDELVIGR